MPQRRLNNLLPVTMDRFDRQNPDEPVRGDLQLPGPLPMRPTALGLMHFALRLAADRAKNEALWSELPPLDGAYKFRGLAPGALVLADSGANVPLLVAHQYGDGRVMAFAGDSTWHWWMRGFESAHKRFWRQIILWLAKKDQAEEGAVWVKLAERRLAPSQRVEFTVARKTRRASRSKTPSSRPRSSCPTARAAPCPSRIKTARLPARSATRKPPAITPSK